MDARSHRARPWRVHTLVPDFELLDLWRIPLDADPARERFVDFLRTFVAAGHGGRPRYPLRVRSVGDAVHVVRLAGAGALFAFRRLLGRIFALDTGGETLRIPGRREARVRERLDDADRARDLGVLPPPHGTIAFEPVYAFEDEALLEIANKTIHGLLHLSWIDGRPGRRDAALAVYVKSRGLGSRAYLALIKPFRYAVVYPAWIAHLVRTWQVLRPTAAHPAAAAV